MDKFLAAKQEVMGQFEGLSQWLVSSINYRLDTLDKVEKFNRMLVSNNFNPYKTLWQWDGRNKPKKSKEEAFKDLLI